MLNFKNSLNNLFSPIKKYKKRVIDINKLEASLMQKNDIELKQISLDLKAKLKGAAKTELDENLPLAFALVREIAKRELKQRHYDVQLIGGMILHDGNIAEMKTGEGKTQMATLPTYLNALAGKGVHVVTVNDYLSRRDAAWMGQIYDALGLTVSVITQEDAYIYDRSHITKEIEVEEDIKGSYKIGYDFLKPISKKEAYEADITYGTNNAFGFDYLFDNLAYEKESLKQRQHYMAIIDEADSILIDESRTPLIISQPSGESEDIYKTFAKLVKNMQKDIDYKVDEKHKTISILEEGIIKAENFLKISNLYSEENIKLVHHLDIAIRAISIFQKEVDYIVKDDEVLIVDSSTGRIQSGRRWSEGIHQAIEAKENVSIKEESKTAGSITYQNFFRLYERLSGMTGTGMTSQEEFVKVYGLDVIEVPTNKPIQRKDLNDLIFVTELGKFKAIAKKIKEINKTGQPILIGTISIEKNELLSKYLISEGVKHNILNAKPKFAEKEGEIIASAGKKYAVTIATNMAGRGVDIKLGGAEATEEEINEIKALGGLYVIGTERHEARRIDNQLRGRSGRQGDPGTTQFYVSMEDDLMRIFASSTVLQNFVKKSLSDDMPIEFNMLTKQLENAQKKIEGFHFDSRRQVLQYDDVMSEQRKSIYSKRLKLLLSENDDLKMIIDEVLMTDKIDRTEEFYKHAKMLLLQLIDMHWVNHLDSMDHLKNSVGYRQYGQKDAIVEYKTDGLRMFKDLFIKIDNDFRTYSSKIKV